MKGYFRQKKIEFTLSPKANQTNVAPDAVRNLLISLKGEKFLPFEDGKKQPVNQSNFVGLFLSVEML